MVGSYDELQKGCVTKTLFYHLLVFLYCLMPVRAFLGRKQWVVHDHLPAAKTGISVGIVEQTKQHTQLTDCTWLINFNEIKRTG